MSCNSDSLFDEEELKRLFADEIQYIEDHPPTPGAGRKLLDRLQELGESLPDEAWKDFPRDASDQVNHPWR